MTTNQRHFPAWGLGERQELVQLCRSLPVLSREAAVAFFDRAEQVTSDSRQPNEWTDDILFTNLGSTLAASDRQDFDVRWQLGTGGLADGVLVVETYDIVISTLQCVARVSEHGFLTRVFAGDDIERVKELFEASGAAAR